MNRNSRAGSETMYETIEEMKNTISNGGGQTAKVEETVLFAREVVENSATRATTFGLMFLVLVIARILRY